MIKRKYRVVGIVREPALTRLILQKYKKSTGITQPSNTFFGPEPNQSGTIDICISHEDMDQEKYQKDDVITISIEK